MKRLIVMVLCMLMVTMFCSCTQQGPTSQSEQSDSIAPQNTISPDSKSASAQPETDTLADGIMVTGDLPDGWEPVEGSVLPAHFIKNGTAVYMVMHEGYPGDTIDAVTELAQSSNESVYDEIEYEGETETIMVDGIDARKFVFTYEMGGVKMKSMCVYLFVEGEVYAITFNDFSDTFGTLSEDFAAILAQIHFE